MKVKSILTVIFLLTWFAGDAGATTYRWTDERGVVHFSDNFDNIPTRYREQVRIESEATPSVIPRHEEVQQPPESAVPPRAEPGKKDRAAGGHKSKKHHHRKHDVKAPAVPVSPARRAQNQAEEQIRRDRQAIEDAQLPARRAQEKAEEQIRRAREGTMGH